MNELNAMPQEEASACKSSAETSPLDKPLQQLTENDIAQVTREDCRRYLKKKGMRRPSWNKSQAIQQVIMLKALLEAPADSDDDFRKKFRISRLNKFHDTVQENVPHRTSTGPVFAEDTSPYSRKDLDKVDVSCGFSGRSASAFHDSTLSRTRVSTSMPVGQMAIFYSGMVNVYDDVPADKAQAIMHVAANPLHIPPEQSADDIILIQPSPLFSKRTATNACSDSDFIRLPCQETVSVKASDISQVLVEEFSMLREDNPAAEGSSARKASVQRYLEKRKDRFKIKRKAGITSCTSLDIIYLNDQMGHRITSEHLRGRDAYSPPHPRPLSTPNRCCSEDNDFIENIFDSSGQNK